MEGARHGVCDDPVIEVGEHLVKLVLADTLQPWDMVVHDATVVHGAPEEALACKVFADFGGFLEGVEVVALAHNIAGGK